VIGTAVPASSEGPQGQEECGRWPKVRSPPAGNGQSFRVLVGASREEAPEEEVASRATRLPGSSESGERSGTQERFPQEGPRNMEWFWLGLRFQPDRADRTTSELSGHV